MLNSLPDADAVSNVAVLAAMLNAIHAQDDKAALVNVQAVANKLKAMKRGKTAHTVEEGIDDEETLMYMNYPREHWSRIRTNNALERLFKEMRRRTRVYKIVKLANG